MWGPVVADPRTHPRNFVRCFSHSICVFNLVFGARTEATELELNKTEHMIWRSIRLFSSLHPVVLILAVVLISTVMEIYIETRTVS